MFIESPPTTRHQRLMWDCDISETVTFGVAIFHLLIRVMPCANLRKIEPVTRRLRMRSRGL